MPKTSKQVKQVSTKYTEAEIKAAVAAVAECGGQLRAADKLGGSRDVVQRRLSAAKRLGIETPTPQPAPERKPIDPTDERVRHLERQVLIGKDEISELRAKLKSSDRKQVLMEALGEIVREVVAPV